jgi:hypothetical protein
MAILRDSCAVFCRNLRIRVYGLFIKICGFADYTTKKFRIWNSGMSPRILRIYDLRN